MKKSSILILSLLCVSILSARVTPQRRATELRYHFGITDPVLRTGATLYSLPKRTEYGYGTSEQGLFSLMDLSASAMVMLNNQHVSDSIPFKRPTLGILSIDKSALGISIYGFSIGKGVSCEFSKRSMFNLKGYYHFGISRAFFTDNESQKAYTCFGVGFDGYGTKISVKSKIWATIIQQETKTIKPIFDITVYSHAFDRFYFCYGLTFSQPTLGMSYLSKKSKVQLAYTLDRGIGVQLGFNICSE